MTINFRSFQTTATFFALIFAVLALSSCREGEQGRVLLYDKGTYLGKTESGLAEATVEHLQDRALLQATASGTAPRGGGGGEAPSSDNGAALRVRAQQQTGN